MIKRLIRDETGSVNSAELVLIMTLLTIGMFVGMKTFRDATVTEFADYAQAVSNLDQSFSLAAISVTLPNGSAYTTAASSFDDADDFCDTTTDTDTGTSGSVCVNVCASAQLESTTGVP
jgi:Flp pilus assembly pilin Flp